MGIKMGFFVSGDWIKKFFEQKELQIKISLSVQRSVVESFKFNDKNISGVYIRDAGQCFISQDVYAAVGFDKQKCPL